ncbi:hypothetical protein NLM33_17310 [Bradyrhizobium sp. CCGUVB1N3]|uniref:hypothetical protein n=1 Tax=Bradyrhizobium sp. CCGUVB1N3 TaxID=2949629 RepID=UPI0020B33A88|nr:hypothetical protein [Bradyrhizobium sp. CCGUVB1N3]MCP3472078.1 hypothetical protein [Bradyrhizobium sp. CCGUVB1N3]
MIWITRGFPLLEPSWKTLRRLSFRLLTQRQQWLVTSNAERMYPLARGVQRAQCASQDTRRKTAIDRRLTSSKRQSCFPNNRRERSWWQAAAGNRTSNWMPTGSGAKMGPDIKAFLQAVSECDSYHIWVFEPGLGSQHQIAIRRNSEDLRR